MTQRTRMSDSQRKRPSTLAPSQDDDITFTQPSSSQVIRALENMTANQVEQKTAEVVQYLLVKDQKKFPLRRADLVKHVLKEHRSVFPEILMRATRTLDQVFGLQLLEIDPKNHLYVLVNKLQPAAGEDASISGPSNPKRGLLLVILGVVFMKGGVAKENVIWNTLRKLRLDPGEKHEEFGDIKKLIVEEFVRQRYLEYTRVPHTEPVEHVFHWGQRANVEVSKVKVLEFMAELHGQDVQSWPQQLREAQGGASSSASTSSSSLGSSPIATTSQTSFSARHR